MKSWAIFILALAAVGCTRKYVDYDVVNKLEFQKDQQSRPVAPVMRKGRPDKLGQCFNQWLFFSNADKERERYVPQMVQVLCPGSDWLLDSRMTTVWWTTIIFSRSCVEFTTHCPEKRPR